MIDAWFPDTLQLAPGEAVRPKHLAVATARLRWVRFFVFMVNAPAGRKTRNAGPVPLRR
jgi:hypothetical protein